VELKAISIEFKNYFIHYIINGLFPLVLQCINLEF